MIKGKRRQEGSLVLVVVYVFDCRCGGVVVVCGLANTTRTLYPKKDKPVDNFVDNFVDKIRVFHRFIHRLWIGLRRAISWVIYIIHDFLCKKEGVVSKTGKIFQE